MIKLKGFFTSAYIFILLIIITCYIKEKLNTGVLFNNKPFRPVKKIPNILWKTFDYKNDPFWFANNETVSCPVEGEEFLQCNIYLSWEDYPANIDAYIIYAAAFFKFPEYRDPKILWGLVYEESSRSNPIILNEKFLNLFNFSATYSRYSDIPFPLIHYVQKAEEAPLKKEKARSKVKIEALQYKGITSKTYYVTTKMKNFYLKEIAPVLYIQSNPITFVDRDQYVLKLMEYIAVDSCGKRINNRKLPKNLPSYDCENYKELSYLIEQFWNYTARYKFQIAIESSVCNDYVTEKLWRPIVQGVVPIYFGSPSVRDWLPNKKSAILIEDFATPELLAKYLRELLSNDSKYEEHLEHKTKGIITNQKLLDELKTRPTQLNFLNNAKKFQCFLCEKLHEQRLNSSKVNIVTRESLDCKMPYSILTHSPDLNNPYLEKIYNAVGLVDYVYDKYMKRELITPIAFNW